MEILEHYSLHNKAFSFSKFVKDHHADIMNLSLEMELDDWRSLKKKCYFIVNEFKLLHTGIQIEMDFFRIDWDDLMLLRRTVSQSKRT
ncbi:hypothetical protein MAM1_0055c03568 [Mucor ambiguus]|uniref:Uncharacterized protein n=1 Tax=Mucor ambiguus TaxID=91626 RepID=A0A0C9M9T5_9FUNG|nr:hypothetical protein MAM1_0055c03568 [Mucor ambiguus]